MPRTGTKLRLEKVSRSPLKGKKLRAFFSDGTHVDFGAAGYSDYTKHRDPARKERYILRHRAQENWRSPKARGTLSRFVLWNKPTLAASIADYKRRFGL